MCMAGGHGTGMQQRAEAGQMWHAHVKRWLYRRGKPWHTKKKARKEGYR